MPDNPHSKKLAFERDLMEQTGLTRGQLREKLFEHDARARAKSDAAKTQFEEPTASPASRTEIQSSETKFEPQAFRTNTGAGEANGGGASGTPVTVSGIFNGAVTTKILLEA